MSKRNITFNRPAEPTFLKRIKEQVGYKEGPTVDTKRKELDAVRPEDLEDTHEEQPTVVVLKPGDLTAEEADDYKQRVDKEENDKPADLSSAIVFKAPVKQKLVDEDQEEEDESKSSEPAHKKQKKHKDSESNKIKKINKTLLSFDDDEEDY